MVEVAENVYIQRYSYQLACWRYSREDIVGVIKEELIAIGSGNDGGEKVRQEENMSYRKIEERAERLKGMVKWRVEERLRVAKGLGDTLPADRREGREL